MFLFLRGRINDAGEGARTREREACVPVFHIKRGSQVHKFVLGLGHGRNGAGGVPFSPIPRSNGVTPSSQYDLLRFRWRKKKKRRREKKEKRKGTEDIMEPVRISTVQRKPSHCPADSLRLIRRLWFRIKGQVFTRAIFRESEKKNS